MFCIKKIARQGTPELAVAKQTGASKTAAVCFSINATLFCPFPQLAVRNRKQSECRKYEGEGELSRQIRHKKENAYFSLSQTHPILKNARRINFCDSTFGLFKKSTSGAAQPKELSWLYSNQERRYLGSSTTHARKLPLHQPGKRFKQVKQQSCCTIVV